MAFSLFTTYTNNVRWMKKRNKEKKGVQLSKPDQVVEQEIEKSTTFRKGVGTIDRKEMIAKA